MFGPGSGFFDDEMVELLEKTADSLAFAFSKLEVSDSLMLAQRQDYYPITKTIYELSELIGTGKFVASALGVWAMLFLAVMIIGSSIILGKKMGALFRA